MLCQQGDRYGRVWNPSTALSLHTAAGKGTYEYIPRKTILKALSLQEVFSGVTNTHTSPHFPSATHQLPHTPSTQHEAITHSKSGLVDSTHAKSRGKKRKMDTLTEGLYVYRPLANKPYTPNGSDTHDNEQANIMTVEGTLSMSEETNGIDGSDDLPYECTLCGKRFRLEQVETALHAFIYHMSPICHQQHRTKHIKLCSL